MKKVYFMQMAALLSASPVMAKDYYLSANGSDSNDGSSKTLAFATLKAAAEKLQAGDVLHVSGIIRVTEVGTFAHKNAKPVTFIGENPQQDGFDGKGKSSILNPNDSWVVIKNLKFINGYSESKTMGGAFTASGGATSQYEFDNCIFQNNTTSLLKEGSCMGGAIWQTKGSLKITNCKFLGNQSLNGGAMFLSGVEATVSHSAFIGNSAETVPGQVADNNCAQGGVVWSRGCKQLSFVNNVFRKNYAQGNGGVMRVQEAFDKLIVKQCAFIQNRSDMTGGCLNVNLGQATAAQCDFLVSTFAQNDAASSAAIYVGGQKDGTGHIVNVINCTIAQNTQSGDDSTDKGINIPTNNTALKYRQLNNILCGTDMKGYLSGLCSTYYPIQEDSKALSSGSLKVAKQYGVTEDQHGVAMTLPYAGAVQIKEDFPLPAYAMSENWKNCMPGVDASSAIQVERTFERRKWESVCLPFALSAEQIENVFGLGTQVARFYKMEGKDAHFVKAKEMEAGVPYLIYSARSIAYSPIFTDVEVTAFVPSVLADGDYQLAGVYDASDLGKGLRAYWQLPEGVSEADLQYVFDDEIVTGIKNMPVEDKKVVLPVYSLMGHFLGYSDQVGKLPQGIYIIGKKKIVAR